MIRWTVWVFAVGLIAGIFTGYYAPGAWPGAVSGITVLLVLGIEIGGAIKEWDWRNGGSQ